MEQQLKDAFNKSLELGDEFGMSIINTRARLLGFELEFKPEEEEKETSIINKHERDERHKNLFI